MASQVYLNGEWLSSNEAKVSVFDRGFLFGDGVYEVVVVYKRNPFRLEQHLSRLSRSLQETGIPNPFGLHEWRYLVEQSIAKNNGEHQSIYIQVTRGVTEKRSHNYPRSLTPTVLISNQTIASRTIDTRDILPGSATLLEDIRWARGDIKSISLLGSVLLKKAVFESGEDEGILHRDGLITEGTASNVFIVRNGKILTPKLSDFILTGITRDFIFELASKYDLSLVEADISVNDLLSADEVWLTSSTAEVKPIVEIDGKQIGNGLVGPVWTHMAEIYQKHKSELFSCGS